MTDADWDARVQRLQAAIDRATANVAKRNGFIAMLTNLATSSRVNCGEALAIAGGIAAMEILNKNDEDYLDRKGR